MERKNCSSWSNFFLDLYKMADLMLRYRKCRLVHLTASEQLHVHNPGYVFFFSEVAIYLDIPHVPPKKVYFIV